MPSHIDPPPPIFHHSPAHVFAAASMALFSNRFRRIAGHRVELPEFLAGVDVECGDVSAERRKLAAGIADEDLALGDAGRHRDRVRRNLAGFRFRESPTKTRAAFRSPRRSPDAAVDDGNEHLAFVQRDAAAVDAAAKPGLSRAASSCDRPAGRSARSPCRFAHRRRT